MVIVGAPVAAFVGLAGMFPNTTLGGAWESIVQLNVRCGGSLTLPPPSTWRTSSTWVPSGSDGVVNGLLHAPQLPLSSLHSKVLVVAPVKVNVLVSLDVEAGITEPAGAGGMLVKTDHMRAAPGPVLPAASTRRTRHVRLPSARPVRASGDVHATHDPASSWHS